MAPLVRLAGLITPPDETAPTAGLVEIGLTAPFAVAGDRLYNTDPVAAVIAPDGSVTRPDGTDIYVVPSHPAGSSIAAPGVTYRIRVAPDGGRAYSFETFIPADPPLVDGVPTVDLASLVPAGSPLLVDYAPRRDLDAHIAAVPAHADTAISVAAGAGWPAGDLHGVLAAISDAITNQEAGDSAAVAAAVAALADLADRTAGGPTAAPALLKTWAAAGMFDLVTADYNADAVVLDAVITWTEDGSPGLWTTDTVSDDAGAPDTWHVTHALSGLTVTQPGPITRDPATFAITAKPALQVA